MTCEVAVLNRMAIALAADSAVTYASFVNGRFEQTYASGANKIFQLSSHAPVGVMLFNNAALQDVPWELIVKCFRAELADGVKSSINEYAEALAAFVRGNTGLFPADHRERHFKSLAGRAFFSLLAKAQAAKPILATGGSNADMVAAMTDFVASETALNAARPLWVGFDPNDIVAAKAAHRSWLEQEIAAYAPQAGHLAAVIQPSDFAELAIDSLYKFYREHFGADYTGIVVAGFGEHDYFPAYAELRYYGFLLDRLVVDHVSTTAIGHNKDALIEAFAKKSMVDTFLSGFAPEVWTTANNLFRVHAEKMVMELNLPPEASAALPALLTQAQGAFGAAWADQVWQTHYAPLTAVISGLPPSEMAELAETLVMLESLKEKVTQRTQSVGGPVDVAVITKAEGLVWIKRKHYFRPELNNRYFIRQSLSK